MIDWIHAGRSIFKTHPLLPRAVPAEKDHPLGRCQTSCEITSLLPSYVPLLGAVLLFSLTGALSPAWWCCQCFVSSGAEPQRSVEELNRVWPPGVQHQRSQHMVCSYPGISLSVLVARPGAGCWTWASQVFVSQGFVFRFYTVMVLLILRRVGKKPWLRQKSGIFLCEGLEGSSCALTPILLTLGITTADQKVSANY